MSKIKIALIVPFHSVNDRIRLGMLSVFLESEGCEILSPLIDWDGSKEHAEYIMELEDDSLVDVNYIILDGNRRIGVPEACMLGKSSFVAAPVLLTNIDKIIGKWNPKYIVPNDLLCTMINKLIYSRDDLLEVFRQFRS